MIRRMFLLGLAMFGAMAAMAPPASAQVVDDFMCSTFSYKCKQQKPLPPPQLAPGTEPIAATPAKHAHVAKKHKAKGTAKRTAAPAESAPTSPPSPDAAAK